VEWVVATKRRSFFLFLSFLFYNLIPVFKGLLKASERLRKVNCFVVLLFRDFFFVVVDVLFFE